MAYHLFFVMNNLNKAVSDAYVSRYLREEKVVYFYLRPGIERNPDITGVELFSGNAIKFISDRTFFHYIASIIILKYKYLAKFDKKITDIVGEERFYAYIPHVYLDFLQAAISHPNCSGCFLVEEGDASYLRDRFNDPFGIIEKRSRTLRAFILRVSGVKRRVAGEAFFPEERDIMGAVGLGKSSFPFYKKSLITLDPMEVFTDGSGVSLCVRSKVLLFLIDPLVSHRKITCDDYISALRAFVKEHRDCLSSSRAMISFHPTIRHDAKFCKVILEGFREEGISLEVFEGGIEKYLVSNPDCVVFGLISSSLRYGKLVGCKVFTWLRYVESEMLSNYSELDEYHSDIGVCSLEPGQEIMIAK